MMNQPDNTIPFDLEKWKEGYEVVCRDGTVIKELHYFESAVCGESLAGVYKCQLREWLKDGDYFKGRNSDLDLFLRPKMEKWYRRAYWKNDELVYAIPSHDKDCPYFYDNYFVNPSIYKWAGPIEEFEVMAREG